ncbi:hypothetical protein MASR2M16_01850 [Thauera terpenica]
MGATRSQPNLSGRVAPRHPPRLGDWQVRPDGTALQFVQETDDDGRAVKHFRCVDTLGLLLKGAASVRHSTTPGSSSPPTLPGPLPAALSPPGSMGCPAAPGPAS